MYHQEVDVCWGNWCLSSRLPGMGPSTAALSGALQCLVVALRGLGVLGFANLLLLSYVYQRPFWGKGHVWGSRVASLPQLD